MAEGEYPVGMVLLGKYRVDDQLGIGGMARVVKATHLYLQQPIAIKVLLPHMVEDDSTVARFLREAQATVRLKSEHIARVQDVGTFDDGAPYMVMEYLEGSDLNQVLRQYGPQGTAFVCDLMLQACEGIAEAHGHGIVHRDIKPSNFFLTRRPDGSWLLKILDFGISKAPVGYDDLTGTQTVIGTPTYMAPEQMKNGRAADARSDIWSLGVVMYQLLNGRPPFSGESYADLILKVGTEPPLPMHVSLPTGLGEIIWRCLEKVPAHRFQDVSELARSLAPYASDPQMGAVGASRASRILMATRQSRVGVPISGPTGAPLYPVASSSSPYPMVTSSSPYPMVSSSSAHGSPPSSLASGRGQQVPKKAARGGGGSNRSYLIIGGIALAATASGAGFLVSQVMGNKSAAPAAAVAPAPAPVAAPTPPPPAPTAATTINPNASTDPAAAGSADASASTKWTRNAGSGSGSDAGSGAGSNAVVAATAPPPPIKPAVTKTVHVPPPVVIAKKSTVAKTPPATKKATVVKPATKADVKITTTKKASTTKKPPADSDLFDSRK